MIRTTTILTALAVATALSVGTVSTPANALGKFADKRAACKAQAQAVKGLFKRLTVRNNCRATIR